MRARVVLLNSVSVALHELLLNTEHETELSIALRESA